jgi:4-amino-4-deoxy-L-arabinose transferase-like glycosyltransferase
LINKAESSKQIKSTRGSGLKGLVDHRALRAVVLVAVLLLAAYTAFFRLGVEEWDIDEPIYRNAGLEYVQDSNYTNNREHPFLVKFILGITQVVFGSSEAGVVRIPAATAFLLTGLVLFAFARRVAGYWVGVLALALWTISPLTLAFGRVATLEVFLAFFCTLALYLGWRWAESGSWWFAAFSGVVVGLATASKVVGILFLPAIVLVGLLKIGLSWRSFFQSTLVGLAVAATALATYAPLGSEAPSAIQYMLEYQSHHNEGGHSQQINGLIYKFPPWWAHLWWQWEFYGTLATLSLGVAIIFAVLRRRALELYLLVAVLVPFLFLSFYAQVRLHHYFGAWQPPLILLLALAAGKLALQGRTRGQQIMGGILAVLLLAPFAYLGVETVKAVSQVRPGPNAAVAKHLEDTGHDRGPILVQDLVLVEYLPKAQLFDKPEDAQGEEIDAVIMDSDSYKPRHEATTDYLAANTDKFEHSYTITKQNRSRFELSPSEAGDVKVYVRRSDG